MLSDATFFFFLALLGSRYLQVDRHTNNTLVLAGSRPLTLHIIIITRLKADWHLELRIFPQLYPVVKRWTFMVRCVRVRLVRLACHMIYA